MNPEMVAFAGRYGFAWKAHRVGQPNRKAGKERNFLTLETNFLPARSFTDLDDLNGQAKQISRSLFVTTMERALKYRKDRRTTHHRADA